MQRRGVLALAGLILLAAPGIALADTLVSPTGGWQSWTLSTLSTENGVPFWNNGSWDGNQMNVGFCLTGTGGCTTQIVPPPGILPYWGTSTGAAVPAVYFQTSNPGGSQAALKVEIAGNQNINIFG